MTARPKTIAPKNAAEPKARVVSTGTVHAAYTPYPTHLGGMTYTSILASIPTRIPGIATLLDPQPDAEPKLPRAKYANSRDAAHAGDSLQRFFERDRFFYDHAAKGLMRFAITPKEAEFLRLAIGFGHRSDDPRVWGTSAHPIIRAAFGFAFNEIVCAWAAQMERPSYTVTILKERWHTTRRRPAINAERITREVETALDAIGFGGLLFIEIQGMRSQERDLHPHVHGIITPKRKGALSEAESRARLSKLFPDLDGAKGVSIRRCQTEKDVEHFLMYSAKSPDVIKHLYTTGQPSSAARTRQGRDGTIRLRRDGKINQGRKGYSARFALDILVLRSKLSLPQVIIAHGKQFEKLKRAVLRGTDHILEEAGIVRERCRSKDLTKVWKKIALRNPAPKPSKGRGRTYGPRPPFSKPLKTLDI